MRSRKEIKTIAKEQFRLNYWNCVLAALLVSAVIAAVNWLSSGQEIKEIISSDGIRSVTLNTRGGAGGLLSMLITGPLTIGLNYFFIKNVTGLRDGLTVTTPFSEAFKNYPRKLGGSLWMGLFTFLWGLLFIIPGIIKYFSYSMTQFILADCPDVKAKDALRLSMRMMKGHKGEYFVLCLSFIGWGILTAATLGILGVFYTVPYFHSTVSEYYLEVRDEAIRTGAVTVDQLQGLVSAY